MRAVPAASLQHIHDAVHPRDATCPPFPCVSSIVVRMHVQIARWHENGSWLRGVRDQLGYHIEDFEQNLVAQALLAARTGTIPEMYVDAGTGLRFRPGKEPLTLRMRALADRTVMAAHITQPKSAAEWERYVLWAPQPDDLGIAERMQPASSLRGRWHGSSGSRVRPVTLTRHDPHGSTNPLMQLGRQNDSSGPTAHSASSFTRRSTVRLNQLVIPSGQYSVASTAQVQQLVRRKMNGTATVSASRAEIMSKGSAFLAIFPPVRIAVQEPSPVQDT